MSADLIHKGHINIIQEANKYGYVIVGLLTDKAIESYKRIPLISYDNRKLILDNLKGIQEVVPQETLDYVPNLLRVMTSLAGYFESFRVIFGRYFHA